LLAYPAYLVGFLAAATVYWLLQPIAHLAVGRYLIGVLGGTCIYFAATPIVSVSSNEPFDLSVMLVVALIAGGIVGPAVSLHFADG